MNIGPSTRQKKRLQCTPEQDLLFKQAYGSGLIGVGRVFLPKLKELAEKTGLPLITVQKKICNMRRKKKKRSRKAVPNAVTSKSHLTGYNLYSQEVGSTSDDSSLRHQAWSKGWQDLSEESKGQFNERAKYLNNRELHELSSSEKAAVTKNTISQMKRLMLVLGDLGHGAIFVCHWSGALHGAHTTAAREAWGEVHETLSAGLTPHKESIPSVPSGMEESGDALRMELQQKIAKAYGVYLNGPPKRFPYTKYTNGKLNIRVLGLPSEVPILRPPGNLGNNQKRALLAADFSFEAMSPNVTEQLPSPQHSPTTPEPAENAQPDEPDESPAQQEVITSPIVDTDGNVYAEVVVETSSNSAEIGEVVTLLDPVQADGLKDVDKEKKCSGKRKAKPRVGRRGPVKHRKSGVFEVDHITDSRTGKNGLEFLVRWNGYEKDEDSWVPIKDILDSTLITNFYTKGTARPTSKA